jgi:hypothetical protein
MVLLSPNFCFSDFFFCLPFLSMRLTMGIRALTFSYLYPLKIRAVLFPDLCCHSQFYISIYHIVLVNDHFINRKLTPLAGPNPYANQSLSNKKQTTLIIQNLNSLINAFEIYAITRSFFPPCHKCMQITQAMPNQGA